MTKGFEPLRSVFGLVDLPRFQYSAGMIKVPSYIIAVLAGLFVLATTQASTSTVEGTVRDASGQPLRDAEIRIEGVEGSAMAKTARTDDRGHYIYRSLGDGTYMVSLVVNGSVKASIANVGMATGNTTTLNFEMRKGSAAAGARPSAKGRHYVWVPSATGTNIAGRWVEVDDSKKEAQSSLGAQERLIHSGGQVMQRIQDNAGVAATSGK
jgi:hypothetical protein